MTDLTGARWRKSTRSGDNGGDCVEVSTDLPDTVAVRDSKDALGPVLTFSAETWSAFVLAMRKVHSIPSSPRPASR
ncbi:DUF397 domain-containing protein [Micromonospora chalcea]|uniref:DUF397 domain-containing protein n=1 Tax=Micromonospora chalcea TaxID=1874 RepID=UPI0021A90A08|nr:DUF397 domain-containing protein [Micromonospora chalcea]MCT2280452.1 DUF397 domain-containing protein [Micromonospora chalcea]